MKKFSKVLLMALFALTTSLSAFACGGGTEEKTSNPPASSETTSESVKEESSEEVSSEEESSEEVSSEEGSSEEASSEEGSSEGESSSETSSEESSEDIAEVFGVTFDAAEGLTVNGEAEVTEGESYSFYVSVNTGYQKTDAYAVSATMGGNPVTLVDVDGDYTIENVTGEIVITVSGVEKKTFNVTKPETVGVEFTGAETVVFGESYTFTIDFAGGYTAGKDFAVSVNGKTVEAVDGIYTVENVKSVLVITVEGMEEVQYTATFTSDYADALENVEEGFKYEAENYTFKIELTDKYTQCADNIAVFYKVEGSEEEVEVTPDAEGVYTIANPKANVQIIVKNVELNRYLVKFMRNAVLKYELWGTAGKALTEEQVNEALAMLVGENEEFVAWREDITATIEDDTIFSVVTRTKEAWGTLIEGNPLKGGEEQTGEYSAAGYEKVYVKTNFEKAPFAEIDISAYGTVKFAFKHASSWILLDGWTYYLDCRATWIDVTMVRNAQGDWVVTMEAPVNHNLGEQQQEVLNPYTTTLTGSTLNAIFANWYNDSNATTLYVTELRGELVKPYGEEIVAQAIAGSTETTEVSPAIGFSSVYKYASIPAETTFADVDILGYSEVKFSMWLDNGYICIISWGAYAENAQWGKQWVPVTLTNNGSNWTVSIEAHLSSSSGVLEAYPYTYEATGTKLSEVLATWFDFASETATIYITEIRGTERENVVYGSEIAAQALKNSSVATSETAPAGFEKVYSQSGFAKGDFAEENISGYETVRFQMKANSWILFDGWSKYIDKRNTWLPVEMINNGGGNWAVTVDGQKIACANGTTLNAVLSKWCTDAADFTIYITEIRGIAKEGTEQPWGTVIDECVVTAGATLDETATAPEGFEYAYVLGANTQFNNSIKSTTDLSNYSEVRFAVKATKYFLINGWGVYFKESYTDWATVVMKNNGDGTWTVTVYADVFTGATSTVDNPYVITCTGTSVNEILSKWESDSTSVYVTELRGTLNER